MTGKNNRHIYRDNSGLYYETSIVPEVKKEYTHEQLHEALLYADDMLSRSLLPFILLKDTAESVARPYGKQILSGDKVYLGVKRLEWVDSKKSTFESLVKNVSEDEFEHTVEFPAPNGVVIHIDLIANKYPCLENPDEAMYCLTKFAFPNPMSGYREIMDTIR